MKNKHFFIILIKKLLYDIGYLTWHNNYTVLFGLIIISLATLRVVIVTFFNPNKIMKSGFQGFFFGFDLSFAPINAQAIYAVATRFSVMFVMKRRYLLASHVRERSNGGLLMLTVMFRSKGAGLHYQNMQTKLT